MTSPRLEPPGYPDVVRSDEDRERFARLYDDLVRVTGLTPADALLNAATQFQLGFDVRGPFEKRKRRKRVVALTAEGVTAMDDSGPTRPAMERVHLDLEPPGS